MDDSDESFIVTISVCGFAFVVTKVPLFFLTRAISFSNHTDFWIHKFASKSEENSEEKEKVMR